MKFPSLSRPRRDATISALYGAIVTQARAPVFYRHYQVPDSVNGRLDMIMLHIFMFYRRLAQETPPLRALGQGVFDRFCQDMDDNLREMGIGDLTVPKQMKRIGEAYYGRASAYESALADGGGAALTLALRRNVYGDCVGKDNEISLLSSYVESGVEMMAATPAETFAAGGIGFPVPVEPHAHGADATAAKHPEQA